ncbi:polysaccharide biosynthesis tyrosine autokinase [Lysobacter sp. H21R4]|uniref:GumC family protein n=1 Tax=Lysobacter sp. H21R4 TaxID=2781021 RepID=UPI001886CE43|nr:polysaccharide biosynthesis tyrosine autokinase [Lysobacter sp. H21R4]QOY62018.1 polysaccharide biosynthesis tyrosine autokinase [Lysobacter sp. H21R4]
MSSQMENVAPGSIREQDLAAPARPDDDEIDLLAYWQILRERQWLVLGVLGTVVLLTLVITLLATPIYRAATTVQIERDTMKVTSFEGLAPIESPQDRDFYQTQYELLQSRSLAQRVIQDLNLVENPHFAKTIEKVNERLAKGDGAQAAPAAAQLAREQALVESMAEALTIEPVRNSRLVKVNFDSPDPQLAARVANAYAEGFIASNLERRFDASAYATKYLEERLAQLKARLEDSEKELVQFSEREQIVSVGEGAPSLSAQNLSQLNASLSKVQDERIQAESRWRHANTGSGLGLPQVVSNLLIQKLREQRAGLAAEYQQNLGVYKPEYPDMVRLQGQIRELDSQVATEVANIRSAIKADYDAAVRQEALMREQLTTLRGDVLDLEGRSIQYNILRREADTNRQIYDALLQRYKEIGVAGGVGANNISVIDPAIVPNRRHSPRLALNLAVGLLLGGFLGVLAAFVLHFLDRTVKTPDALRALIPRPVLGVIPLLGEGISPAQAAEDARSPFAEAYRSLRTALQFSTPHGLPHSLLVTSASASEGKSTTAMELARNIAQLDQRVVLVDADLRNPSVHRLMSLSNSVGLSSLLAGAAQIGDVVQPVSGSTLSVITSGPLPPSPPELLAGDGLAGLLESLRRDFDVIVLDGPPVLGLADAPLLANRVEATLLVVSAEKTRSDALQVASDRLVSVRAHLLGTLLTGFDHKRKGEGYGYSYYSYGASDAK